MIFVTLGSQKFQFNRLLKEIDRLIEENEINEEVFAQTGYSDYQPKNYNYKEFLDREEFNEIMSRCDKVITHGGTGAIVGAVKKEKKVVAVPRLAKYGEHVDNHQIEIINEFKKLGLIECVDSDKTLEDIFKKIDKIEYKKYYSNTHILIDNIEEFIKSI